MSYGQQVEAYRNTAILGSGPDQLIPVLYEHLLVSLRQAQKQIETGDIEGKARSVIRAREIVHELFSSLDMEAGGELSSRLASLYMFFSREIASASRELDAGRLEPISEMVAALHDSWVKALESLSNQDAHEA
jgi:flagellar secretion chaperone FliS